MTFQKTFKTAKYYLMQTTLKSIVSGKNGKQIKKQLENLIDSAQKWICKAIVY